MKLQLLASHFKNSYFIDPYNCPVAKAAKEHFKTTSISVKTSEVRVEDKRFMIVGKYGAAMYQIDLDEATISDFDSQHIRTIILTEV